MGRRSVASIASMVAFASLLPMGGAGADSHSTFDVVAGAYLNDKGSKQVSHRFYPGDIDVRPGDVLRISAVGTRSIALLPLGYEPTAWFAEYSTPTTSPWTPLVSDPDEGAEAMKLNANVGFASAPFCGTADAPCSFDGAGNGEDGVLSSGLSPSDFTVQVDAAEGQSFWIVDLLTPTMSMKVDVVGEGQSSDPAALVAAAAQQLVADEQLAASVHQTYATKKVSAVKDGKTTWTAWAGVDEGPVSLRYMYPLKLTIKKGQSVRWKFSQLLHGARTVTFPKGRAVQLNQNYPQFVCDLDGDEGAGPDVDPQLGGPPYCIDPRDLELDLPAGVMAVAGDGIYKGGTDFESSGLRGAGYATNASDFVVKFPTISTKKGFKYASIDQPSSVGTVVVKS